MKTIPKLQKEVHKNAVAKGWYEKEKSVPEHISLIHSEVSEALEADRIGLYSGPHLCKKINLIPKNNKSKFESDFSICIKDSFEDELADIVIRVMDLAEWKGIDLQSHIEAKMRYNRMRPYKHGDKKY